jgi:CBS domain containing-hemolysin-like protein
MLPDSLLIAVALGLVLLNAFFTAAELSMARVRNTRMEELTQEGDWRAETVRAHQDRLQYFLSATQLGITLASLGLGWVGEPAFAHMLKPALTSAGIESDVLVHNISAAVAFCSSPSSTSSSASWSQGLRNPRDGAGRPAERRSDAHLPGAREAGALVPR